MILSVFDLALSKKTGKTDGQRKTLCSSGEALNWQK